MTRSNHEAHNLPGNPRVILQGIRRVLSFFLRSAGLSRFIPGLKTSSAYGACYFDVVVPARPKVGATYEIRLSAENTGKFSWKANEPRGHSVDLFVRIDESMYAIVKLPRPEVKPGESATFHLAVRAPLKVGPHVIQFDLVEQGVAWFSDRGVSPLRLDMNVEECHPGPSDAALDEALKHNIWHYLPTQGIAESRAGRPFPLFIIKAKGCRIWDAEGHEYIDYTMAWGSTILGYADERIQQALREIIVTAPLTPFPHPVQMEVARMLSEDFPCAEQVMFGKNGSDVCTLAARLARLFTGKKTILSCGFHGWQDFVLEPFAFADSGIPDRPGRTFHKFRFNDRAGFLKLFRKHRGDLAAVMIEPSGPYGGETVGLEPDADPAFLQTIAEAAKQAGALLIFDEIITGYRYPGGGLQKVMGVVPDLTCLGKALASGMPLAALVGRSDIFYHGFGRTHYCPTFKDEVYSLAVAKTAIEIYRTEPVADRIWEYGQRLKEGIQSLCSRIGIDGLSTGPPFRTLLVFRESDPERLRLKRTLYVQELLKAGIVTATGVMLPSTAHDEAVLDQTLAAVEHALRLIDASRRTSELHKAVEVPLL